MKKRIHFKTMMLAALGLLACLFSWAEGNERKPLFQQDAVLKACALEFSDDQVDAAFCRGMHSYRLKYGLGPSPCFQKLLDDLTFTEFESSVLKRKLRRWRHLPFPVIWAILDRTKPLQTSYLMESDFCEMDIELPEDLTLRDKIAKRFLKENQDRIDDLQSKHSGKGLFDASTDFLVYLKIALIKQIGMRLANIPPEWGADWKNRVILEMQRRMEEEPKSIQDWYLLECYREAIARIPGQGKKTEKSVWETQRFKEWWTQADR